MAQEFDFDIGNVVGPPGATGNGIKSIQLLSTSGLVKTYRITFTDDTHFDFSVSDGEDGNGISGASFDAETNALTITFDDGTSFTTPSLKGAPGNPGDDGYSPAVTIETITGGHRVTITDEAHPSGQSFDVLNGTSDYTNITNKPQINGHTLSGNQSAADLGLGTYSKPASGIPKTDLASDVKASLGKADSALQTAPVQSVNGKTGAVNLSAADVGAKPASYTAPVSSVNGKTGAVSLDSGNIGFDSAQTYQAGSVGAELQDLDTNKQDAPSTTGTAGQILALALIDGKTVPVWITPASGGDVTDVQIDGTSILDAGVANIPIASYNGLGLVKLDTDHNSQYGVYAVGTGSNAGLIRIAPSSEARIKAGVAVESPITPVRQHSAAFYGLAKAAGDATQSASANAVGTYTEDAKSAISEMLNGSVAVSGTTPTIAAKAGISYVCGEVATLDITLPASGCFDVVFQSGSTPTVLTATGVTWANDFDATALEADTTYEINIKDGLGVVQTWT